MISDYPEPDTFLTLLTQLRFPTHLRDVLHPANRYPCLAHLDPVAPDDRCLESLPTQFRHLQGHIARNP